MTKTIKGNRTKLNSKQDVHADPEASSTSTTTAAPTATSTAVTKKEAIVTKYPKYQTDILMLWMIEHKHNPCPSSADIEYLKSRTGLNGQQITNWTTNVRKRNVKATTKGGKKPHHFIDFLFLALENDKLECGQLPNQESKCQVPTKMKRFNNKNSCTSTVVERMIALPPRSNNNSLPHRQQSIAHPNNVPSQSTEIVKSGSDCGSLANMSSFDSLDGADDQLAKGHTVKLEVPPAWTRISPEHEIELLQCISSFDIDLVCSDKPTDVISSNIPDRQKEKIKKGNGTKKFTEIICSPLVSRNQHRSNNVLKCLPLLDTKFSSNDITTNCLSSNILGGSNSFTESELSTSSPMSIIKREDDYTQQQQQHLQKYNTNNYFQEPFKRIDTIRTVPSNLSAMSFESISSLIQDGEVGLCKDDQNDFRTSNV